MIGGGEKEFRLTVRAAAVVCVLTLLFAAACGKRKPIPVAVEAAAPDPLTLAMSKVEEDRGEATGDRASVVIPAELKHYSDRRRFLAVQLAESRRLSYEAPRDFTELIGMIRRGLLVEMEPFSENHILYGVGEKATDGRFTHYDPESGRDIPLFSSYQEFQNEFDLVTVSLVELKAGIEDTESQIRINGRDKARRRALLNELKAGKKALAEAEENKKLLSAFYQNPERFKQMAAEYRTLADFAADFNGKSYDLTIPEDRRQLKIRLLSFIRPEARDVLLEIADSYRLQFGRPLPITSLVRTGDYQRHLRETNKNAATTAVPPHTTGLAFDIYDYFMSAAEQEFLMGEIASLKTAGRVEALREQRNHVHVFAFASGERPDDESVNAALGPGRTRAKTRRGRSNRS